MVGGAGDLDDLVVLNVEFEVAANTAVRANGLGDGLLLFAPVVLLAEIELGLELQGVGRTHRNAVTAIDTGRFGQGDVELGGDPVVEASAGHGNGKRELGFFSARVDALVAEDALVVVPDVQVVLDLDGLVEPLGTLGVTRDVDAVLGRPLVDLVIKLDDLSVEEVKDCEYLEDRIITHIEWDTIDNQ